jgi:hypothetical protein
LGRRRPVASGGRASEAIGLVSRPVKGLLSLLTRLVHLGVDPAKSRHETKHIVLTNQVALGYLLALLITMASPTSPAILSWANHIVPLRVLTMARTLLFGGS